MRSDFNKKEFNDWFEETTKMAKEKYHITIGSPEKKVFTDFYMRELNSDLAIYTFLYGEMPKHR